MHVTTLKKRVAVWAAAALLAFAGAAVVETTMADEAQARYPVCQKVGTDLQC